MARYELFRTALTDGGSGRIPHRLVLAHETRARSGGYTVGKLYHEGGALVAALTQITLRRAVRTFEETLKRSSEYRPEAVLYDHPTLGGGQWLSLHARDGATVLVSMLAQPGARFWVSTRYVMVWQASLPADLPPAEVRDQFRAEVRYDADKRRRLAGQLWQRCRSDSPDLGRFALARLIANMLNCNPIEVWAAVGQAHFEQARDDAGPSIQDIFAAESRLPDDQSPERQREIGESMSQDDYP